MTQAALRQVEVCHPGAPGPKIQHTPRARNTPVPPGLDPQRGCLGRHYEKRVSVLIKPMIDDPNDFLMWLTEGKSVLILKPLAPFFRSLLWVKALNGERLPGVVDNLKDGTAPPSPMTRTSR